MRSRFVGGVGAAAHGATAALRSGDVRRAYLQLVLAIVVAAAILVALGVWAAMHFISVDGGTTLATAALWTLRVALIVIVLVAAPLQALFIVNALFPMLSERLFLAGVHAADPTRACELALLHGPSLRVSLMRASARTVAFFAWSLCAVAISFVPVVGVVLGPVLALYVTTRVLGWELLDPYFEKLEFDLRDQRAFTRTHRASLLGFALPYSLAMSIPLVGPLIYGIAQASAGSLVVRVLERSGTMAA